MIIEIFMLLALGDCVRQPFPVSCWEDRREGVNAPIEKRRPHSYKWVVPDNGPIFLPDGSLNPKDVVNKDAPIGDDCNVITTNPPSYECLPDAPLTDPGILGPDCYALKGCNGASPSPSELTNHISPPPCPVNMPCLPEHPKCWGVKKDGKAGEVDCPVDSNQWAIGPDTSSWEAFKLPKEQPKVGDWLICAPPIDHIRHCKWIALPDSESDK